jgi:hypothetical protein
LGFIGGPHLVLFTYFLILILFLLTIIITKNIKRNFNSTGHLRKYFRQKMKNIFMLATGLRPQVPGGLGDRIYGVIAIAWL